MGAKKKGKGNKLARMSEEEKMRYLQHRAAIEEEARRRKEQLISTFMKNKLKKEEMFSRLNMAKINQQWRQTLRQIKCSELKQDLEDLFKWFDYTANKKNKMIEILLEDLDEAESQYSRIVNCQMEIVKKLIEIHGQRIGLYYDQYKLQKAEIYSKGKASLDDIANSFIADEENLQAILYKMEETFEKNKSLKMLRHSSKIDELRNNMLTEMENLKNSRELQIEKVWFSFESALRQYWEQTEDRRRQYLLLKESDYENCKQIFENNQQINSIIDEINYLKNKLAKVQEGACQRFLELRTDKESKRELLHSLKKKIMEEADNDKKKLTLMNNAASKTTMELQRILAKGQSILQLQCLCRKLETLNEKICTEGSDKPNITQEENVVSEEQLEKYVEPLAEQAWKDTCKLDIFWKRFNRALLEKEALELHHQSLITAQKQLKLELKNCLSELSVRPPESKVSYVNGIQVHKQRPFTSVPADRKYFYGRN